MDTNTPIERVPDTTKLATAAGFWTASTASKAMQKLVRLRAEIFAAQRKARDDPLQEISRSKVETAFSQSAASNGPYLSGFCNYMAFCVRVDVPPFPLTNAMMALWLFEKCSVQNGYFHTYKHGVGLAADIAESLWITHPVYRTMRRFDEDGTALSESLEERRVAYKSSSSNASPKSAAKAASKPREAPRKLPRIDSHASSSSSTDGEHSEYASDGDTASEAHTDAEEEVDDMEPVVVRGLPTCDSVYDSITDIYKTYVAAIVPVYGISVVALNTGQKNVYIKCNRYHSQYTDSPGGMCPWSALCRRRPDGKYIVDFDASTFKHSHGPCKEILADPEWRPVVRNPDARAVLGMDPLPNQTRYKKQASDEPPPHKKARLSKTTSRAKVMPPPPVPTRSPTSVAPRPQPPSLAASPHWCPSAQHSYPSPISPSTPQGSSARSAGTPVLNKPVSAIATSSHKAPRISSPLATWNPTPSVRPSSQPPVLAAATPVGVGSPSAHDDPFELVSAFCAGLHPSLVALAEPLVAAGVHSFDGLVALRVLGPSLYRDCLAVSHG